MAVRIGALGRKARDDDVGPEPPDDRHDVGQHGLAPPETQRLVGALREAEVARAREKLFGAVDAPGREQLLRADEPELGALLGPDEVLAAVAAGHRQVRRAHERDVLEVRQEARVLVVGVRGDVQHAPDDAEAAQRQLHARGVGLGRRAGGLDGVAHAEGDQQRRGNEGAHGNGTRARRSIV